MQLLIVITLPFLLFAVVADAYALTAAVLRSWSASLRRLVASMLRRCRRAARRTVAAAMLAAAAVIVGAALLCRRVAGAIRGAIEGWRGVL